MNLSSVKKIIQIEAEYGNALNMSTRQINAFLKAGWQILSIEKRGYDYPADGEGARFISVFVLGNESTEPYYPKKDIYSGEWA